MALHTIPEIRQIVSDLAQQYGAQRVYLFGSYARGDMTSDSDIDLRIDKGAIRGLAFAGLLGDLEDALDTSVDLISTAGMDAEFLKEIQRDEVLLYESAG
jgi:predicted nucleotidyltransferase|nr:nucleotidyltransferase domain-containing protein [uncultured Oscillibacter sp.]